MHGLLHLPHQVVDLVRDSLQMIPNYLHAATAGVDVPDPSKFKIEFQLLLLLLPLRRARQSGAAAADDVRSGSLATTRWNRVFEPRHLLNPMTSILVTPIRHLRFRRCLWVLRLIGSVLQLLRSVPWILMRILLRISLSWRGILRGVAYCPIQCRVISPIVRLQQLVHSILLILPRPNMFQSLHRGLADQPGCGPCPRAVVFPVPDRM